jgi:hypothetical protein
VHSRRARSVSVTSRVARRPRGAAARAVGFSLVLIAAAGCGSVAPASSLEPTAGATAPMNAAPAPLDEPHLRASGNGNIWTWSAPDGDYEVHVHDPPTFTDDDRAIEWQHPGQTFLIERSTAAGTIRVQADADDAGRVHLTGHLAGEDASSPEALAHELAALLPPVVAHLGLAVDRLEDDAGNGRLQPALAAVERLTSSTAKLAAYEVILHELDEPTVAVRRQLLRHAARTLDGDWFMHQFLAEDMDLSFDEPQLVSATLAALATIQSDDLFADTLITLLDRTDHASPSTWPAVLACATESLQSDAELAKVMHEALWESYETPAGQRALIAALDSLQSDGPLRDVLVDLFDFGDDADAAELIAGLDAARLRIESPELRASALAALPAAALRDPAVLAAWEKAAASIDACDALADLLVHMFEEREADARLIAAVLRVQHLAFAHDYRTSRLLRAVLTAALADAQVATLYREAAESLSSPQDRAELLARLDGATKPAAAGGAKAR